MIDVEYWREAQVHAASEQFMPNCSADLGRTCAGPEHVLIPKITESTHRLDRAETLTKALDPSAFMVHRN